LHARLIAWADANNECVIPAGIAAQFGTYQAFRRLERLRGCQDTMTGYLIRKAAVIADVHDWHICQRCDAEFIPHPDREAFCSDECRQRCFGFDCGRDLGYDPRDEYCSLQCQRTRDCAQCGAEYIPDNQRDGFCSDECRQWYDWREKDPVGQFAVCYLTNN
jgi:hypothetical protein